MKAILVSLLLMILIASSGCIQLVHINDTDADEELKTLMRHLENTDLVTGWTRSS